MKFMDFFNALIFLLILLILLVSIKADFFFLIFGLVLLIFFVISLFFMSPLEIISSVISFIVLNPIGLVLLFVPLIISLLSKFLKKYVNFRDISEEN